MGVTPLSVTTAVLIVLLLCVIACYRVKFARGWWLTLYYAGSIIYKGLQITEDAEYRAMAKSLVNEWSEAVIALYEIHVEAVGLNNVPSDTPCLFLCNHQSRFAQAALLFHSRSLSPL
jgi:1-acyl-sn-glycerol-3-phosphate acyltransferase